MTQASPMVVRAEQATVLALAMVVLVLVPEAYGCNEPKRRAEEGSSARTLAQEPSGVRGESESQPDEKSRGCPPLECPRVDPEPDKDHSDVSYGDESSVFPTHGNTLADALMRRGVVPTEIAYFRFVGDESSQTIGRTHYERDIEWIWEEMFRTAEPYKYWVSSGNRIVEIYLKGDDAEPAARLFVNETDRTEIEGVSGSYIANGFERLIISRLKHGGSGKLDDKRAAPK